MEKHAPAVAAQVPQRHAVLARVYSCQGAEAAQRQQLREPRGGREAGQVPPAAHGEVVDGAVRVAHGQHLVVADVTIQRDGRHRRATGYGRVGAEVGRLEGAL